ncbi:LIC_11485 family protein [Leptospira sp. GIMC2001]|uniref:LIC_11485 family protein n=1 Tax=Leptospira sp. GIMC2001 TaxID=1513297 RepID=UPI00234A8FBA|nr:hypothetical protein [Leptospira sp. GIMC2001]WCL50414.1 hypothetical protein O4O04_06230 [Leptospira sp. GIMC2001]
MKLDTTGIDPKKALGALDNLANKIPDDIAKLLKKIAIALFAFFVCVAAYYGWNLGYGDTSAEGLKIAEDSKSLFIEDLEREYNRKRKNIRISDVELEISRRVDENMIRDSILSNRDLNADGKLLDTNKDPMNEGDLRSQQRDYGLPPALQSPTNPTKEWLPGRDESQDERPGGLERIEKQIEESEKTTERLESTLNRLEAIENRLPKKTNSESESNKGPDSNQPTKEKRELLRAPAN